MCECEFVLGGGVFESGVTVATSASDGANSSAQSARVLSRCTKPAPTTAGSSALTDDRRWPTGDRRCIMSWSSGVHRAYTACTGAPTARLSLWLGACVRARARAGERVGICAACLCARARARAYMRLCVRAHARGVLRACVRAHARGCVCACVCVRACACVHAFTCARMRAGGVVCATTPCLRRISPSPHATKRTRARTQGRGGGPAEGAAATRGLTRARRDGPPLSASAPAPHAAEPRARRHAPQFRPQPHSRRRRMRRPHRTLRRGGCRVQTAAAARPPSAEHIQMHGGSCRHWPQVGADPAGLRKPFESPPAQDPRPREA